jgi:tetratricopeptide (TPR) repeat protein
MSDKDKKLMKKNTTKNSKKQAKEESNINTAEHYFNQAKEAEKRGKNKPDTGNFFEHFSKQQEMALLNYTQAIDKDSSCPEYLIARSKLYLDKGDYKLALRDLLEAQKLNPELDSDLSLTLCDAYKKMGHPELAQPLLKDMKTDTLTPEQIIKRLELYVSILVANNSYTEAIALLEGEMSAIAPEMQHSLKYSLGNIYKKCPYRNRKNRLKNIESSICLYIEAIKGFNPDGEPKFESLPEADKLVIGKYLRALGKRFEELSAVSTKDENKNIVEKYREAYACIENRFSPLETSSTERMAQRRGDVASVNATRCLLEACHLYKSFPVLKEHVDNEIKSLDSALGILNAAKSDVSENTSLFRKIMDDQRMREIENTVFENKAAQKDFLKEKYRLFDDNPPMLCILQHWNSYTPIISEQINHTAGGSYKSTGGGYFIQTGSSGIVIDPGFDFIKNFKKAGFSFNDIDHVFITHAHNDHTTDLESLITLLHNYNKDIIGDEYSNENSNTIFSSSLERFMTEDKHDFKEILEKTFVAPRHKRINLFMTASTFKKYVTLLKLDDTVDYKVTVINKNTGFIDIGSGWYVKPLAAKHEDILSKGSKRESVGFLFVAPECCLVYTGDTGFDDNVKAEYEFLSKVGDDPSTEFKDTEYRRHCEGKDCILLAHIGGFKQSERHAYRTDNLEKYYEFHLGRLGLARLVKILKPKVCLVSEFGEEFIASNSRTIAPRIKLCQVFTSAFKKKTTFVPADIGLRITLDETPRVLLANGKNRLAKSTERNAGIGINERFVTIDKLSYKEDRNGYLDYLERGESLKRRPTLLSLSSGS